MDFKPGIYEDLDYPTYDSIPAWRSHDLTAIAKCPFSWKFGEFKEPPALLEGRVQHSVFLEHHKFFDEYAIEPMVDRRTKAGKAEYAEWLEGVGDRTPIKQDLYELCMARREVVSGHIPQDSHRVELTICFIWNNQPCKGKLDWHTGRDIWDLKTCRDASPRAFVGQSTPSAIISKPPFTLPVVEPWGCQQKSFTSWRKRRLTLTPLQSIPCLMRPLLTVMHKTSRRWTWA